MHWKNIGQGQPGAQSYIQTGSEEGPHSKGCDMDNLS